MKYLKISLIVLLASCTSSKKEAPNMPGAYLMESQTVNHDNKDTKYTDLKQLKFYTDGLVMYTQLNPSDSISGFGVGSYTSDTSGVTENLIFRASGTIADSSHPSYKLNITTTTDGYNQIIPQIMIDSQNSKLTEVYQKVGTSVKSPLDGVWKELESYTIKGNDTARNNRTQYKAYYQGYFMFGQSVKDAPSASAQTGIGFGTFEDEGNNKIKEMELNASFPVIAGHSFTVNYEWIGTDNYKQTINNSDSSRSVEIYERIK
jgi:hypothetical protein